MNRIALITLAGVLLLALATASPASAGTSVKAPSIVATPQGVCDEDHILDLEIIQGTWYECACDSMIFGPPVCEWQEILSASEDPQAYRKLLKRTKKIVRIKGGYLYVPRVRPVL